MSVTVEQMRQGLRDLAERIERGENLKSVTIRYFVGNQEHEHTFSVETQEERDAALVAIRTVLGQVH